MVLSLGKWGVSLLAICAAGAALAQAPPTAKTDGAKSAKVTQDTVQGAQDTGDDSEKTDDAFQPKGVEVGTFLLLPKLEVDGVYNSNTFASGVSAKPDYTARVAPEVKLRSRFARHELNFEGRVEQFSHVKFTSDDHLDVTLLTDGRLDIEKTWESTANLLATRSVEDRSSPNDVGGKKPTPTDTFNGRLGTKLKEGNLTFTSNVNYARKQFGNVATTLGGPIIRNDLRNRDEYQGIMRVGYEVTPGYEAIVQGTGDFRRYDSARDTNGFNRSSDGYRMEAGIGVDISQLVRGDFLIGYLNQDYQDPRLKSSKGLSFKGALNWTPTRLTIIVPSLERSVVESIAPNVTALNETVLAFTIRHELRRNIILFGAFAATFDDYNGTREATQYYTAKGRITYAFSRELYIAAETEYRQRGYAVALNQDFNQVIMTLRVGARY